MLNRYRPSQILNPTFLFVLFGFLFVTYGEEHFTHIAMAGGTVIGIYIGSAWRGAHERWLQTVWRHFKDGEWRNEKARKAYADRAKHLSYWMVSRAIWLCLGTITFIGGGLILVSILELSMSTELTRWISIPLAIICSIFAPAVGIPLLWYHSNAKDGQNILGRLERSVNEFQDISDLEKP